MMGNKRSGEEKRAGLWRKMKQIRESMDSAAIFTIGVRKDNKYDILEVMASKFGGEMPDVDDVDEGFGELPKPGKLSKGLSYIG